MVEQQKAAAKMEELANTSPFSKAANKVKSENRE